MKSPSDGNVISGSASSPQGSLVGNHCFGCGPANRNGMRLRFTADQQARTVACRVRVPRRFEGPPGHVHGGIIATILDEAMGKVNKLYGVVALTRRMEIDYLRPVPLAVPLLISGRAAAVASEGRKHFRVAEIRNQSGESLATSTGLFIAVDPEEMFAKHLRATGRATGRALEMQLEVTTFNNSAYFA